MTVTLCDVCLLCLVHAWKLETGDAEGGASLGFQLHLVEDGLWSR